MKGRTGDAPLPLPALALREEESAADDQLDHLPLHARFREVLRLVDEHLLGELGTAHLYDRFHRPRHPQPH
jgi:hypothetical protein